MSESDDADDRARRIEEAARDLFLRYGYDKTTVSEIAEGAGISKGAVYLHFDSKDDLFEAVLADAIAAYGRRWVELVEQDPDGGTIGGIYKNILYALEEHEFVAAMLKQDERLLGSYLHKPDTLLSRGHDSSSREVFVERMQEAGVMREDLPAAIIAHVMNIISYGLVAIGEVIEADQLPPTDTVIEVIAEIMDRALTPETVEDPEAGKRILREEVASATREMLDDAPLIRSNRP